MHDPNCNILFFEIIEGSIQNVSGIQENSVESIEYCIINFKSTNQYIKTSKASDSVRGRYRTWE